MATLESALSQLWIPSNLAPTRGLILELGEEAFLYMTEQQRNALLALAEGNGISYTEIGQAMITEGSPDGVSRERARQTVLAGLMKLAQQNRK